MLRLLRPPRLAGLLPVACILAASCVMPNRDPNILGQPPFNQVTYSSHPEPSWRRVDVVTVTLRGAEANILNTVPALYRRALEVARSSGVAPGRPVYISGITLDAYTKRELFNVPYQDCHTVYEYRVVTEQECRTEYQYGSNTSSYRCHPVLRSKNVPVQKCETKYRQEMRDVLYQTATGEVHA